MPEYVLEESYMKIGTTEWLVAEKKTSAGVDTILRASS